MELKCSVGSVGLFSNKRVAYGNMKNFVPDTETLRGSVHYEPSESVVGREFSIHPIGFRQLFDHRPFFEST